MSKGRDRVRGPSTQHPRELADIAEKASCDSCLTLCCWMERRWVAGLAVATIERGNLNRGAISPWVTRAKLVSVHDVVQRHVGDEAAELTRFVRDVAVKSQSLRFQPVDLVSCQPGVSPRDRHHVA